MNDGRWSTVHGLSSLHRCFDLLFDLFHFFFDLFQRFQRLLCLLELGLERVDISSQHRNFEFTFGAGLGKHFAAFIFDLFESLFEFLCLRFQPVAGLFQLLTFTRGAVAFLADVVEQFVGAQVFGVDLCPWPSQ